MRKYYFLFYVLSASLILLGSIYAGDRMVLVERFTSSTCGPCAQNNPIMDAFLGSQNPEKITAISYHMNWPGAGNDPFYLYNPSDNTARRTYYGVNSIPQAQVDGIINVQPPYIQSSLQAIFNSRTDSLGPVTVIVRDTVVGDSMKINVLIYCETPLSNPFVTVHIAVIEKEKNFSTPPGSNGETHFTDIMRKMLPNGNGSNYELYPGTIINIQKSVYMDHEWQANQMRSMVFVQAANKEILNANTKLSNFCLLPSTAYGVVYQGQNQNANYKIKIPYVSAGYNSAVTLTAQVLPATSGITASFPSGSTISNFPDSVTLNVSSAAAVPAGDYKIVVTGTSASGKVHKTSVSYLVGKNYVFIGSNRPNAQFKVDNVVYTTTQFFTWNLNSVHNLAAISPQVMGSTQLVFQSWSNNGTATQDVTISPNTKIYTVNYKMQYKLITSIVPSGIQATVTGGNTFYDSASTASFSITPLQVQYNNKTYFFQNWQGLGNGSYTGTNPSPQVVMNNIILENAIWDTIAPIGVGNLSGEVPKVYSLFQNYPNPFNPVTTIKYALPKDGEVNLKIYDVLGNEVAVIFNGYRRAGYYEDTFDASNIASGIYFYKISAGEFTGIKKMVLIK